ncbi:hypothetical protein JW960_19340 [candidate division KSB1 bacterium]|nr:hypothetical protein [candidate division KSB1 bacterium]
MQENLLNEQQQKSINRRGFLNLLGRGILMALLAAIPVLFFRRNQITQKQTIECPNNEMCQGCISLPKCTLPIAETHRQKEKLRR